MEKKILILMPFGLALIVLLYYVIYSSNENNERLVLKDEWQVLFQQKSDFESPNSIPFTPSDSVRFEGVRSAYVGKDIQYGPTFTFDSLSLIKQIDKVDVNCEIFSKTMLLGVQIVLSIENNNGSVLWQSSNLGDNVKAGEWFSVHASFPVDAKLSEASKSSVLKVYFLNNKNEEIFIDNFTTNLLAQ